MPFTRGGDSETESDEQSREQRLKTRNIKVWKKTPHQLNPKYEHEPDQPGDVSVSHRYNSHGHDQIFAECQCPSAPDVSFFNFLFQFDARTVTHAAWLSVHVWWVHPPVLSDLDFNQHLLQL